MKFTVKKVEHVAPTQDVSGNPWKEAKKQCL